ncbi:MAG TPA: hypothetical protein VFD82_15820 [Planctomycetota bacterium]|nr:hypothetical protein [Planctomycetota bacterium]
MPTRIVVFGSANWNDATPLTPVITSTWSGCTCSVQPGSAVGNTAARDTVRHDAASSPEGAAVSDGRATLVRFRTDQRRRDVGAREPTVVSA